MVGALLNSQYMRSATTFLSTTQKWAMKKKTNQTHALISKCTNPWWNWRFLLYHRVPVANRYNFVECISKNAFECVSPWSIKLNLFWKLFAHPWLPGKCVCIWFAHISFIHSLSRCVRVRNLSIRCSHILQFILPKTYKNLNLLP